MTPRLLTIGLALLLGGCTTVSDVAYRSCNSTDFVLNMQEMDWGTSENIRLIDMGFTVLINVEDLKAAIASAPSGPIRTVLQRQ